MALDVSDILALPELRTRLVSGAQGLKRAVRWAHVCELADPTEWLGDGDLLMTTGMGIPPAPQAQRDYVQRLATAGLAGLMIGENMQAPENLDALLQHAQTLGFAVMLTHYGVPFAAVTRAIVDAGRQEELARRNAITRVYESARMSLKGLGLGALLKRLANDVQAQLTLLDARTLAPWRPDLAGLAAHQRDALAARQCELSGNRPVMQRLALDSGEVLVMPLPSQADCLLVAEGDGLLDYGLLHHVVAVLGIELERLRVDNERNLRLGSELLDDLLQQRLPAHQAQQRLAAFGIAAENACVLLGRAGTVAPASCDEALQRLGARVLLRVQGDDLIVLGASDCAAQVQSQVQAPLGVSNPLGHTGRCLEALREARLALAHAGPNLLTVTYAQAGAAAPWLAQSLDEAERTFRSVLGSLADYDHRQHTQLLPTLQVFLQHNRSWLLAAAQLHVHKQTLVYRVRRIEEITGRSMDSTEDVATLWFALRAAHMAGLA
ncbi:PucR family transcriptional regulator [Pseudomonas aegrilactucae]|uniref:PucR family transcriptional regulator n=1 Tax=Pseudomonas aegrilactucae TaxID=2854028 RepID=A0A9Q3AE47_9PSED|nr:PucR family transcriptional regulator [Pseudomonas aegrilactucae]MBV6287658.1 PucR family transcriptional regulator [Pseudomonas aegrilactucae]